MPRPFSGPAFDSVAYVARLTVPADRAERVREELVSIYELIDKLDELDLAETPPATAFDARWE